MTRINKRSRAVQAFKLQLDASDQWHNTAPFPANESDERAYKACHDPASAKIHCPQRWAAVEKWSEYIETVMSMIYPKIQSMFYFTGPKATAANCPIQMLPHYNPSNGAMFFRPSRGNCTTPSHFGLPFFLKRYGPKFQEWSVIGHESRPGHHTQMQGSIFSYVRTLTASPPLSGKNRCVTTLITAAKETMVGPDWSGNVVPFSSCIPTGL